MLETTRRRKVKSADRKIILKELAGLSGTERDHARDRLARERGLTPDQVEGAYRSDEEKRQRGNYMQGVLRHLI